MGDWLGSIVGRLQDRDYIERLADACTSRAYNEALPEYDGVSAVHEYAVRQFKDHLQIGSAPRLLPNNRPCRLVEDRELKTNGSLRTHRWTFDADGQTLIVDVTAQRREAESADLGRVKNDKRAADLGDARLERISLRANDLTAVEEFYRYGLGVSVTRTSARELLVGGFVRFVEDLNTAASGPPVLLSFQVRDLPGTATRLNFEVDSKATWLRLRDPAGNDVDVWEVGQSR